MKTILEAETAYREAEDELKARRDRQSDRSVKITLGFAISGIALLIVGVLMGLFLSWRHTSTGILLLVGAFLFSFVVFRMHMSRMHPKPETTEALDAAFDELEEAQKRWLQSAGFEAPTSAIDELGFDLAPKRYRDTTFGNSQLLEVATGKVVPVLLKHELGKGYVLYGPEGPIVQEYPLKEGV